MKTISSSASITRHSGFESYSSTFKINILELKIKKATTLKLITLLVSS